VIQLLLILHGVIAAILLGAITHQAFAVPRGRPPATRASFVGRYRAVHSPAFTNAVILMFVATFVLGGLLYPRYRIDVRPMLEDMQLRAANGIFESKEHFAAVGLGLLPVYWLYWRPPLAVEYAAIRRYLTWMLAFIVWWNFLTGEVLNNIKGLFP
jgi:hypothetical protein